MSRGGLNEGPRRTTVYPGSHGTAVADGTASTPSTAWEACSVAMITSPAPSVPPSAGTGGGALPAAPAFSAPPLPLSAQPPLLRWLLSRGLLSHSLAAAVVVVASGAAGGCALASFSALVVIADAQGTAPLGLCSSPRNASYSALVSNDRWIMATFEALGSINAMYPVVRGWGAVCGDGERTQPAQHEGEHRGHEQKQRNDRNTTSTPSAFNAYLPHKQCRVIHELEVHLQNASGDGSGHAAHTIISRDVSRELPTSNASHTTPHHHTTPPHHTKNVSWMQPS